MHLNAKVFMHMREQQSSLGARLERSQRFQCNTMIFPNSKDPICSGATLFFAPTWDGIFLQKPDI